MLRISSVVLLIWIYAVEGDEDADEDADEVEVEDAVVHERTGFTA